MCDPSPYPPFCIWLTCAGILCILGFIRVWVDKRRPRHKPAAAAEWGIGGPHVVFFLAKLGLLFIIPPFVFYYFFFIFSSYSPAAASICCLVSYMSLGFPFWPTYFAAMQLLFILFQPLRKRTRPWLISLFEVKPEGEKCLVLPCGRGMIPISLAQAVGEHGWVEAADEWTFPRVQPMPTDWVRENAQREGIPPGRLFLRRATLSALGTHEPILPFAPDHCYTFIVVSFPVSQPMFERDNAAERRTKLCQLWAEVVRVGAPGCRVFVPGLSTDAALVESTMKKAGLMNVAKSSQLWASFVPFTVVTSETPVIDSAPSAYSPSDVDAVTSSDAQSSALHSSESGVTKHTAHYMLRLGLMLVMVASFLLGVFAMWWNWQLLCVPSYLPWHNQLSSLATSSMTIVPLTLYFHRQQLSDYAKTPSVTQRDIIVHFLKTFVMWLLGLTLFQVIFWVPSFLLDVILFGRVSPSTIGIINTIFNVILFVVLFRTALWAWKRYQKARQGEDVDDEEEEVNDLNKPLLDGEA